MSKVKFDFKLGRVEGEVVRVNDKTLVVQFKFNGKTIVIKRHIDKHNVEFQKVV